MPSRRHVLAALGTGLGLGAAAGYVGGVRFDDEADGPGTPPAPLATVPTEWSFVDYDAARTRNPPPESAPDGDLRERWRHPLGDAWGGSPVVGNERVVLPVYDRETWSVRTLDLASGDRYWEWRSGTEASVFDHLSVATAGNSVFCTVDLRHGQSTRALAATTGSEYWRRDGPRMGRTPITAAGHLLAETPEETGMTALDARTGDARWTIRPDDRFRGAPAADGERIVATTFDHVLGFDPETGTERWRGVLPDQSKWGPVLADGRAFVGTFLGDLVAYDAASGELLWRRSVTGPVERGTRSFARYVGSGAVTDDALVAVEDRADDAPGVLHVLDPDDGTRRWSAGAEWGTEPHFTPPVVVDGTVYVGEHDRESEAGRLVAVDPASGERTVLRSFDADVRDVVVAEGRVLVVTGDAVVAFG